MRGAEPDDPARWLSAIARNECLTRIRERMRQPLSVVDADEAPSAADPVAEAARRADIGALWSAVGELAPQQREALLLREFGGLSYDELALALGVSVPAVESLLFRARARLRLELRTVASALAGLLPRLLAGGGAAKVAGATVAVGLLTGGVVASERALTSGHAHGPHASGAPALVSPLSDLPVGRVPARAPRKTDATSSHRAHTSQTSVAPAPFVPSTQPPVVVADSTPPSQSPPASSDTSSTGAQYAQSDNADATRAPVIAAEDSTQTPATTEDTTSDGGTTTTPASTEDNSGDSTAATTTTTDGSGDTGGGGGDSLPTAGSGS